MSTPDLSPLEQLSAMGSQQQATPSDASGLSPLEQLAQTKPAATAKDDATIAVPSAGRIPGVMMPVHKVTPGQAAGGVAAGAAAGAAPLLAMDFAPIAAKAGEFLGHLDNVVKVAKTLGYTSFGLKEAHDLMKWMSGSTK